MNVANRIPACKEFTFDGMLNWFAEMSDKELLFHPDEDPAEMIRIADNSPLFNEKEVRQLRRTINRMFVENGDEVYEAAYPIFMKRMKIQLDA